MATNVLSPEVSSMELFRAAIPPAAQAGQIADRLCAIGQYRHLGVAEQLPGNAHEDRLVFVARGVTKLIAHLPPAPLDLSAAAAYAAARAGTVAGTGAGMGAGTGAGMGAGKTQVLAFHFPGDIVSVLREEDGDFRMVALKDTQLVVFFADQFLDVAQDDPAVIRSMLASSIQALHASRTGMMQLGHKCAGQRIAEFLVSIAQRVCGCSCGACEFALPMSRRDIADALGLTIETVSRQFADLREAGLIETEGRSIIRIRDIYTLACRGNCKPK